MENCNKYKKKAIIGLIILVFLPITIFFKLDPTILFITLPLGIYAIWLFLPYLKCLGDNNRKLKPPFSKPY